MNVLGKNQQSQLKSSTAPMRVLKGQTWRNSADSAKKLCIPQKALKEHYGRHCLVFQEQSSPCDSQFTVAWRLHSPFSQSCEDSPRMLLQGQPGSSMIPKEISGQRSETRLILSKTEQRLCSRTKQHLWRCFVWECFDRRETPYIRMYICRIFSLLYTNIYVISESTCWHRHVMFMSSFFPM